MRQPSPEWPIPMLEVCFIERSLFRATRAAAEESTSREKVSPSPKAKPDPELDYYVRVGRRPIDDDPSKDKD